MGRWTIRYFRQLRMPFTGLDEESHYRNMLDCRRFVFEKPGHLRVSVPPSSVGMHSPLKAHREMSHYFQIGALAADGSLPSP